ncbi:MAG: metallophosphoesterase [Rubripirellula sp.]|nr:metallophosphoesterase [Rubripirellula sp.]
MKRVSTPASSPPANLAENLPTTSNPSVSRRDILAASAAAVATTGNCFGKEPPRDPVAFFLVGDTHYFANKEKPGQLDERSRRITTGLINTLNTLQGTAISAAAGGGTVAMPRGVIHAGDLIDSGDKNGQLWEAMQKTEWQAFESDFGIAEATGRLRYPTFEVHGNHDGPQAKGIAINGIIARNQKRTGLTGRSASGLHCSWDWGPVHFVNLGIVVGQVPEVTQRRRYAPMNSLEFLVDDLKAHVGDSRRPVVITHHIDLARYSRNCMADDPANLNREWHPCDVRGFYNAIRDYNVVAILHGHTHARNVLRWDGDSTRSDQGISVFNVDNSAHFHGGKQAFFYSEISNGKMLVRECCTEDGWESYQWTPQVWSRSSESS